MFAAWRLSNEVIDRPDLLARQWILLHGTILSLVSCRSRNDPQANRMVVLKTIPDFYRRILKRIFLERLPRLGCIPLDPGLFIEDTFVHRWKTEDSFFLSEWNWRFYIVKVLALVTSMPIYLTLHLRRLQTNRALVIKWSPKFTSEAQSDEKYKDYVWSV